MKQYTTTEQTAKLIELGFERPFRNEYLHIVEEYGYAVNKERNFSIGELIDILPTKIESEVTDEYDSETVYLKIEEGWTISYFNGWCTVEKYTQATELIDALYDMLVRLKEEGVI